MIDRRQVLCAAALSACVPRLTFASETARPKLTTWLVGFSAGGALDAVTRLVSNALKTEWKGTAVVENKPGAAGLLAVQQVRRSPPDGSVLMTAPIAVPVLNPVFVKSDGQTFGVDYLPVAQLTSSEFALVVPANHPARDPAAFVKWLRSGSANGNFGVATRGNVAHLLGVRMGQLLSTELVVVPYKGAGNMIPDVVSGVLQFAITQEPDVSSLVQSGSLREIMTFGTERSDYSRDVPTALESGINVSGSTWNAVFAPPKTPESLLASMSKDIGKVLSSRDVQEKLKTLGARPTPNVDYKALSAVIEKDIATFQPIARAIGA
jgi:tripartite-type tricarboxylate transporter receptor subunit TctC